MLREAKRQTRAYQKVSILVLGRYAAVRSDLDLSEDVLAISSSAVADLVSSADDMDVDGSEAKIKDGLRDDIIASAAFASGQVFSPIVVGSKGMVLTRVICTVLTQSDFPKKFAEFMKIMASANSIQDKLIAEAVFDALGDAFQSISKSDTPANIQNEAKMVEQLRSLLFQPRYGASGERLRTKRARAMAELAGLKWNSLARSVLRSQLKDEIASEPTDSVREILEKADVLMGEKD
jgi:hypothetical protein